MHFQFARKNRIGKVLLLGLTSAIVAASLLDTRGVRAADPISFAAPLTYAVAGAQYLAIHDLDNDGKQDLVVVGGNVASVLYGNGDGTLQPAVSYPLGPGELGIVVAADVNNDGRPDLLIANSEANALTVLYNLGNRTFSAPTHYPVGNRPFGVAVGDFNGDGALDVAVSNHADSSFSVLLNRGDGTFGPATDYPSGGELAGRLVAADLNGDGILDLAIPNYLSSNLVTYFGDGNGNFTYGNSYDAGAYASHAVAADFNGDGHMDLATANTFDDSITVFLGNGLGDFSQSTTYSTYPYSYPHVMSCADLDGDGNIDLVVPHNGSNYFSVLENIGGGRFAQRSHHISGGNDVRVTAVGDFNGDGQPDVAVVNTANSTVSIFRNTTRHPIAQITLTPNEVIGGKDANGTITLAQPAGPKGAVVNLGSSMSTVAWPKKNSVVIPAGQTTGTFSVKTVKVFPSPVNVQIQTNMGGNIKSVVLHVLPK